MQEKFLYSFQNGFLNTALIWIFLIVRNSYYVKQSQIIKRKNQELIISLPYAEIKKLYDAKGDLAKVAGIVYAISKKEVDAFLNEYPYLKSTTYTSNRLFHF